MDDQDLETVHLASDDFQGVTLENQSVLVENADTQNSENEIVDCPVSEVQENLIGGTYKDLDECYSAYNDYAYVVGFSVRKGKQYYYAGTDELKIKWYVCSCAGVKDEKSSAQVAYNKFDIRTKCQAKVSFEKEKEGVWKVSNLDSKHNHVLALPHERHFLRSHRHVTKTNGDLLETFVNSGIRPVNGISYLVEESGGHQNMPFMRKDAYNYLHSVRKTKMGEGDVGGLFSYFRNKKEEDPLFEWDFDLDDDGRLANLFWRDGKSRLDYDYFGEVVSFDTTYRTNKYGLKCAVFVGVNNHWKNVILGCGFLSWETTESFEWLFGTFLRLMGGKEPTTIFTDQAPAIISAVKKKLPKTRLRLCQWHISENAPKHIGSLNSSTEFWELLHKCFSKCDTDDEFEKTWMEIRNLDKHENSWLDKLYHIRHHWSTAFNNDVFNAGIKSTSRSESTNRVLNGVSNLTSSLYDFVLSFERDILGKWRENERHDDYRCTHLRVPRATKSNPLLRHASQVYTHNMYKIFESELTSSLNYGSVEVPLSQSEFNFEVFKKINPEKVRIVYINMDPLEVRCPCRKFESMGILCRHALRALDMKNVNKIPERYIIKRWRKDVRDTMDVGISGSHKSEKAINEPAILYSNRAMRHAYGIISKSRPHKEARNIVWKHLINANKELNEFFKNIVVDDIPHSTDTNNHGALVPLDPRRTRPKGEKNQRKKSVLEKKRKQTAGLSDSARGKIKKKNVDSSTEQPA